MKEHSTTAGYEYATLIMFQASISRFVCVCVSCCLRLFTLKGRGTIEICVEAVSASTIRKGYSSLHLYYKLSSLK